MILDLHLAIAHHLLAFVIFGALVAELGLILRGAAAGDIRRAGIIDAHYGLFVLLILIVGFARAMFAAKGWAYYSENAFFWAKMGALALVGLLSIAPTLRLLAWRRALKRDPAALPDAAEIRRVRGYLWAELGVFALVPSFAAVMARGYGMIG